ncbi:MAG: hypothetical protein JRE14_07130 [Deltaproteobacteria bacterium]|nr:hypothetical protein [Deltaproteobacteria bacterium]
MLKKNAQFGSRVFYLIRTTGSVWIQSGCRGLNRPLVEVEAEHILNVLNSVKGNKTQAAQILGIDRKTLLAKMRHAGRLNKIE